MLHLFSSIVLFFFFCYSLGIIFFKLSYVFIFLIFYITQEHTKTTNKKLELKKGENMAYGIFGKCSKNYNIT